MGLPHEAAVRTVFIHIDTESGSESDCLRPDFRINNKDIR